MAAGMAAEALLLTIRIPDKTNMSSNGISINMARCNKCEAQSLRITQLILCATSNNT
jgi:hypothetical protein